MNKATVQGKTQEEADKTIVYNRIKLAILKVKTKDEAMSVLRSIARFDKMYKDGEYLESLTNYFEKHAPISITK